MPSDNTLRDSELNLLNGTEEEPARKKSQFAFENPTVQRLQERIEATPAPGAGEAAGKLAREAAYFNPVTGPILSAQDLKKDLEDENYVYSALDALGMVPLMGGIGREVKNTLKWSAELIAEFRKTKEGQHLFGRYADDMGEELYRLFNPEVIVNPAEHTASWIKFFDSLNVPNADRQMAVASAQRGIWKSDDDAVKDLLTAVDDLTWAMRNDLGIAFPNISHMEELMYLESAAEDIGGSPLIDSTLAKIHAALKDPQVTSNLDTVRDYKALQKFLRMVAQPISREMMDKLR